MNTKFLRTKEEKEHFLNIKRSRITEAIEFPSGVSVAERVKTTVYKSGELEAAFLKPGKETARTNPNIYDMYPLVTYDGKDVTERFSFEDIWEYLLKIFLIHRGSFIKILVLLYRLCFFHDHSCVNGKWRYLPSDDIRELIDNLDELVLREGFADKFNEAEPLELFHFLLFVDLLSWNEDVKYHAPTGEPYFKNYGDSRTGRTNTVLSIISAPILISKFIEDIVTKTQYGGTIDVRLITTVIQKFTRSRGLCVLSAGELQRYLTPYLGGE